MQLLTCINESVENKFLISIDKEDGILRNQGLKVVLPIPCYDTIKNSPHYLAPILRPHLLKLARGNGSLFSIHINDFVLRIDNSRQGRYSSGRGYP